MVKSAVALDEPLGICDLDKCPDPATRFLHARWPTSPLVDDFMLIDFKVCDAHFKLLSEDTAQYNSWYTRGTLKTWD